MRHRGLWIGPRAILAVPWLLCALLVGLQSDRAPVDFGSFLAVAALLGTALSLAFTVSLLAAQHMVERHSRALYREFRGDRVWSGTLVILGLSVITVLALGFILPTRSSAAATLWLVLGVGLTGAAVFPHILDTLDRVVLAQRVTSRFLQRMMEGALRSMAPWERDKRIRALAEQGVVVLNGLAIEAVADDDEDLARATVRGIGELLVACLRSVSLIEMIDPTVMTTIQRVDVLVDLAAHRSPVLMLPALLEELATVGVAAAKVPNAVNNEYEPVSAALTETFKRVVQLTVDEDRSAAAAVATNAIGEIAVALISHDRPTAARSPEQALGRIAAISLDEAADHVTRQALRELTRAAVAAVERPTEDLMLADVYELASRSLADTLDRFRTRTTPASLGDMTLTYVIGPLAEPNLPMLILRGAVLGSTARPGAADFRLGASTVYHALIEMLQSGPRYPTTPSNVLDACLSVVVGALALGQSDRLDEETVIAWWSALVDSLVDLEAAGGHKLLDVPEKLEAILATTVSVANPPEGPSSAELAKALRSAAARTAAVTDAKAQRRLASAWAWPCGLALLVDAGGLGRELLSALRVLLSMYMPSPSPRPLLSVHLLLGTPTPDVPEGRTRDAALHALGEALA